jgi:hypothetical protein
VDITVELAGQLLPGRLRSQTLELERPMTVQEVATLLGLEAEEIGLVVINGIQSEIEDPLPPDCRLCFFPYMSGG